jgi:aryl-alcohol dehydrogenase-like predicted oxidoreductase
MASSAAATAPTRQLKGPIALGTVQLGRPYGIANRSGQPDAATAEEILRLAWDCGVRVFDTAQAYGEAEALLGQFLRRRHGAACAVVTKLDGAVDARDAEAVVAAARQSGARLGGAPAALLLHDPALLTEWRGAVGVALRRCLEQGLTDAIGVSVYTPDEFARALDEPDLTVIQAPLNAFDRRLAEQGLLAAAHATGKRVFLRSVYLQGLLLMEPAQLPNGLADAAQYVAEWRGVCTRHGVDPARMSIKVAQALAPFAELVIGCETRAQLEETLRLVSASPPQGAWIEEIKALPRAPDWLTDPRRWR